MTVIGPDVQSADASPVGITPSRDAEAVERQFTGTARRDVAVNQPTGHISAAQLTELNYYLSFRSFKLARKDRDDLHNIHK